MALISMSVNVCVFSSLLIMLSHGCGNVLDCVLVFYKC